MFFFLFGCIVIGFYCCIGYGKVLVGNVKLKEEVCEEFQQYVCNCIIGVVLFE